MPDDRDRPLRRADLDADPLVQLRRWLEEARAAGIELAEAMTVATADASGAPAARMVLLKGADERGLSFYSAYGSRKGRELDANPRAALLFYWHVLGRQVRAEGAVERVDAAESEAYWATRPPGSRLSAAASRQSEVVESREALVAEVARLAELGEPARPAGWGGYRVRPEAWEFWQHREDRLHDRFRYTPAPGGAAWRIDRLAP